MFGKGLFKLVAIGITIAVALLVGSNILNSAISISGQAKSGNIIPLIVVYLSTGIIILIPRLIKSDSLLGKIFRIVVYSSITYAGILSFMMGLGYGLLASLVFFVATVFFFSFIYDPSEFSDILTSTGYPYKMMKLSRLTNAHTKFDQRIGEDICSRHDVIVISQSQREKIIAIIRSRPYLPITLLALVDCDAVIISKKNDSTDVVSRILVLFKENDISPIEIAPKLLSEAILLLPILDESTDLLMSHYRIVSSIDAIENLLDIWPERMRIFGHPEGLRILLPERDLLGIQSDSIPSGFENNVLLLHDYSSLREETKIENTA